MGEYGGKNASSNLQLLNLGAATAAGTGDSVIGGAVSLLALGTTGVVFHTRIGTANAATKLKAQAHVGTADGSEPAEGSAGWTDLVDVDGNAVEYVASADGETAQIEVGLPLGFGDRVWLRPVVDRGASTTVGEFHGIPSPPPTRPPVPFGEGILTFLHVRAAA